VLPYVDRFPTSPAQQLVNAAVTVLGPFDLRNPVLGIGSRNGPVVRTTVPEAAVHEYGQFHARKEYVDCDIDACRTRYDPKPQSFAVKN
jgi:hypothetical protein